MITQPTHSRGPAMGSRERFQFVLSVNPFEYNADFWARIGGNLRELKFILLALSSRREFSERVASWNLLTCSG